MGHLPPEPERKKDYTLKDSGTRKVFETGANRDLSSGKGRFDLLPMETLRALAIHFEKGCDKYGPRNWEKGIPVARYMDSAIRHLFQFIDGQEDENHLIAALWNVACAYQTILWIQHGMLAGNLYDLPNKVTLPMPYGDKPMFVWVKNEWEKIPTLKELENSIKKR